MKKKSIATIVTSVALIASLAVGGSLAYFTDSKQADNTFTVGNVSIEVLESQYHRTNAGRDGNVPEPLSGGYLWASGVTLDGNPDNTKDTNKTWTGEYFSDGQIAADAAEYKDVYFKTHATNMVPGSNVRKDIYVKNTGANSAYVRVYVYVPVDLFDVIDNGPSYWTSSGFDEGAFTSKTLGDNGKGTDFYLNKDNYKVTIDGKEYYAFDFTYTKALEPQNITFWNCWGNIAINKKATNEDLENIDKFDVLVKADAIQANGFANATDAFNAFDAQVTHA